MSFNRDGERVAVERNQGAKVRADLGSGFETGGFRGSVGFGGGDISGLRVVFQIFEAANGEEAAP